MKNLNLTAVIVEVQEGGYVAYIDELRGVITQGETTQEVEDNLLDALEVYLQADSQDDVSIPNALHVVKKPFKETWLYSLVSMS